MKLKKSVLFVGVLFCSQALMQGAASDMGRTNDEETRIDKRKMLIDKKDFPPYLQSWQPSSDFGSTFGAVVCINNSDWPYEVSVCLDELVYANKDGVLLLPGERKKLNIWLLALQELALKFPIDLNIKAKFQAEPGQKAEECCEIKDKELKFLFSNCNNKKGIPYLVSIDREKDYLLLSINDSTSQNIAFEARPAYK